MRNFLAFDIGGTLLKYGVLNETGGIIEKNEMVTEAHLGGIEVLKKVKHIGDGLMKSYNISGICISTAGQVDSKNGEILYASSLVPHYTGMHIKKELEAYFSLPVAVENDVNCVGIAESWIGKGKDAKSLFCLTIGTGIGGSYIIDNKLHTGHSFSGGEIGYIPIEGSQLEELASTRTLVRNVASEKGIEENKITGKEIFELALKGDDICIQEIERLVYYLSKGIATIAYMMNPEMIVIGGGITNQKDYLYPLIMEQLEKDIIPSLLRKTKIEIADHLNDAGMIGALRHFLIQESLQPYNRITTMIESNNHKLTKGESMIAKYIMMNLSDVPSNTISEMAQKINVSESMITRFCKKLEIGSFNELRLMAKEAIIGTRLHDKSDTSSLVKVRQDYINILNNIETLNQSNDIRLLKEQFTKAKQVLLYGSGDMAFIMNSVKYKLMKLGKPIDAFSNRYQMEMSTDLLNPDMIVIGLSLSGYDTEVIDMFQVAKAKGAMTVGITSQQDAPLLEGADMSFLIPTADEVDSELNSISEISLYYLLDIFFKEEQTIKTKEVI
ncbi:ROK family protein [Virgibacillus sp. NKC19-16]|uniref:ROK family protein n=1 Tax=Virgibacillus salidurans TaxID=2831673 RepID=UPI001F1AA4CC|nr:ROK family protein [Virgibacillus sp. NKC19-16]UJL45776.1 ROK family protein [Virgibacillus sp. NKC19-16]